MNSMSESLMFLINIALDSGDKEWFMRLTSPDFGKDIPQDFVDAMSVLVKRYTEVSKSQKTQDIIKVLQDMDDLHIQYGMPKQYDNKIKEIKYKARGKVLLSKLSLHAYGIVNTKILLPDEAKEMWKQGMTIYVYLYHEDNLIALIDYRTITPQAKRIAELTLNFTNVCFIAEMGEGYDESNF